MPAGQIYTFFRQIAIFEGFLALAQKGYFYEMNLRNTVFSALPKKVWILLFVAFIIRLLIFFRFQPWEAAVISKQILVFDSMGYHQLALCIRDNFSFCGDAFRTPGYPFFVAVIYALFGSQPFSTIFAQIFLSLFSIVLMYKIGETLFSENAGFIAAILFSLDLHHTIFIYYILTETIYTHLS